MKTNISSTASGPTVSYQLNNKLFSIFSYWREKNCDALTIDNVLLHFELFGFEIWVMDVFVRRYFIKQHMLPQNEVNWTMMKRKVSMNYILHFLCISLSYLFPFFNFSLFFFRNLIYNFLSVFTFYFSLHIYTIVIFIAQLFKDFYCFFFFFLLLFFVSFSICFFYDILSLYLFLLYLFIPLLFFFYSHICLINHCCYVLLHLPFATDSSVKASDLSHSFYLNVR